MNKHTLQLLVTGSLLSLAGVLSIWFSLNDQGLLAYVLLLFGVWDLGEGLSDFFDGSWRIINLENITLAQLKLRCKSEVIRLTLPIFLSILVEVVLINNNQELYTILAYVLVWTIYVLAVLVFGFYAPLMDKVKKRYTKRLSYYGYEDQ